MVQLPSSQPTPRRRAPAERVGGGAFAVATVRGLVSTGITVLAVVALIAVLMLAVFGPAAPLVVVPDVVAQPQQTAQQALEAVDLKMLVVNYEHSTDVKEGAVFAMSPYAGKQVRAGREVRVTVSRGSRTVKTPDLVGKTLDEATTKLTEADLQVGTAPKQANVKPDGTVLRQEPAPGTKLDRKTKVNLALSGGPDYGKITLGGGQTYLFRTLTLTVPQGPALQMVSVTVSGGDADESFLDKLCRPGEIVKVDLYGSEGARVRVKVEEEKVYSASL